MQIPAFVRGAQVRLVVLWIVIVVGAGSLLFELGTRALATPEGIARGLIVGSVLGTAIWEVTHKARTDSLLIMIVALYGTIDLFDEVAGTAFSSTSPDTMLAIFIVVAVIYVATRDNRSRKPVVIFSAAIALYTLAIVMTGSVSGTHAVDFLSVGIPGQALAIWMTDRLITSLDTASRREAKQATIQRALAECSQALLSRGTKNPIESALKALLGATDADYAYVDVTRLTPDGRVMWEIVADAATDQHPDNDDPFTTGDYADLEFAMELMKDGRPCRLVTAELPSPTREKYEREGIKAELFAPIRIGGRWVGTIGYTDHIREGTWTDVEVEALMRAAEMVAAYWDREAAREGLMELSKAKDRFIASVSHELRTPLTAVVGFAAELVESLGSKHDEEAHAMASLIHEQSIEVAQLVDDLLTAERATSGNLTVRPVALSVHSVCHDVAPSVLGEAWTISGPDVTVHADGLRTRQIVRNLLTNAIRYGGTAIEMVTARNGSKATLTIRDNGSGVTGIDADRIFDAYYRAQERATTPDSVGLGLSVARQLARLMKGDLHYRRENGWTCFDLTLPLAETPQSGVSDTEREHQSVSA